MTILNTWIFPVQPTDYTALAQNFVTQYDTPVLDNQLSQVEISPLYNIISVNRPDLASTDLTTWFALVDINPVDTFVSVSELATYLG